ncbi:AAA family ATPase [Streptomyces sp. SID13031]|uniref:ATP-binding protein n=1 Tax=Streptomyces sp. SID13031 TaxID=2706046 RepID=UPI0013CDC824|nr:AAA family ATPase [Streptomyces sp. SID13031]NEA37318.1 AAA family ATPase [Streptomyces sp. SID13031]
MGIVGRGRELEALRGWLVEAQAGRGRVVVCAGEAGIGKTRLAQEFAGNALAAGVAVVWGRCVEGEGAPAYWPWRQVLRGLKADADEVLGAGDRFRLFEAVTEVIAGAAGANGLLILLDDIHRCDESSLLVLRHLADQVAGLPVLVVATCRPAEPGSSRRLAELHRSTDRLELHSLDLDAVREQLPTATAEQVQHVFGVTGGNPLFVTEVARAIADGSWQPDRPPRTVLDIVTSRLERVSGNCRRMVQAAAIVGRDFQLTTVAAALGTALDECLPLVDEAVAHGFVDQSGGSLRFVHALTRDAVAASLGTAERATLHRRIAEVLEQQYAGDLTEHLADIARHWAELAPYGEGATAQRWLLLAADDAVQRLAYEEGVRLQEAAWKIAPTAPEERCSRQVALGRAAYLAGDLQTCVKAADAAAAAALTPEDQAAAALVLEAVPDPGINAIAKRLCAQALAGQVDDALRARLKAQRSHLAFYDGEQDRIEGLSQEALDLARRSGDDQALAAALEARQEACPGPKGRAERLLLATEMLELAQRTGSPRAAMWGELWRLDALIESGRLAAAAEELPALAVAVDRVGGPVSAWHHDRVAACIAQARGRYAEAAAIAQRGFDRMRPIERAPATGAHFALLAALAGHVGVSDEVARQVFDPPPRFATMAHLSRAYLQSCLGLNQEATAAYRRAGPIETWSLPAFFILPGYVYAALACAGIGRYDDLEELLRRLEPFRGEHAVGNGVAYLGPVELTLGRGAAVLGRLDDAIEDLATAVQQADRAGAPGFVAEAQYHLARALLDRNEPGDRARAEPHAQEAARLFDSLNMTAYLSRSGPKTVLSVRETEVAALVADGLTNRQIAGRLVISERTAQNHVQHILTKLGFATRAQIATWATREQLSTAMSDSADSRSQAGT